MKHYFYAVVAFLALSAGAFAQNKVAVKDLQGTWQVVSLGNSDFIMYPGKGTAMLTDQGKEGLTPQEIKETEAELLSELEEYKGATLIFKDGKLSTVVNSEEVRTGSFQLNSAGTLLTLTFSDGDSTESPISIKNGLLYLHDDIDEMDMVLKKAN